jgi:hypothetical protein
MEQHLQLGGLSMSQNLFGNQLRIAFYDASDGPRLMIFGPTEARFLELEQLFGRLRSGETKCAELHREPFVKVFGGLSVTLECTGGMFTSLGNAQNGILRRRGMEPPSFCWRRTAEGWDYLAKLIEPMSRGGGPCHQYLTSYPSEDVIVVVSKGEYSDDVLL